MRKQILTIGLAAILASSSVYAFGGFERGSNCGGQKMMNKSFMKSQGDGIHNIMTIVSNMDLTSSQWTEIRKTMLDMKKQRLDNSENVMSISFNKDGSFDKEQFVKEHTAFSKDMIDTQSKAIEKIVSILSESQRETLISKLK